MLREIQGGQPELHTVRCCHCTKIWENRLPDDTNTSLFIRHIRDEHKLLPDRAAREREMLEARHHRALAATTAATGVIITPWTIAATIPAQPIGGFSDEGFRQRMVHFLVDTNSSFRLVESSAFRELLRYLNPRAIATTRKTIVRELHRQYAAMLPRVRSQLASQIQSNGLIHLTLDAWTAGNRTPYLGITGHWLDSNFVLHDLVLDFIQLHGSHTAENLALAVMDSINTYGIEGSVGCITCDNASVNSAMCKYLEKNLLNWTKRDCHVRCMAHIINLAVQRLLKHFRGEALESEGDMAGDINEDPDRFELSPGAVLKKVRRVVSKLRASTNLWEALQKEAQAIGLKCLNPILDMKVRYYLSLPKPI